MPNLFSDFPVAILACVLRIDIGIDAHEMSTLRPFAAAIATAVRAPARIRHSRTGCRYRRRRASSASVLPMPENMILSGGTPAVSTRFNSPPDTTSAPAPSRASVAITRLIGIGLDRVADERRHIGEGVGEDAIMPLERRGRIAIERGADGIRHRAETDRLGVKYAVAIGKVVHGGDLSRAERRAECVYSARG